jgi:hypothetical protein
MARGGVYGIPLAPAADPAYAWHRLCVFGRDYGLPGDGPVRPRQRGQGKGVHTRSNSNCTRTGRRFRSAKLLGEASDGRYGDNRVLNFFWGRRFRLPSGPFPGSPGNSVAFLSRDTTRQPQRRGYNIGYYERDHRPGIRLPMLTVRQAQLAALREGIKHGIRRAAPCGRSPGATMPPLFMSAKLRLSGNSARLGRAAEPGVVVELIAATGRAARARKGR